MSPVWVFTPFDILFIQALELGCAPTINVQGTHWICTCAHRLHSDFDYGPALITDVSLAEYVRGTM